MGILGLEILHDQNKVLILVPRYLEANVPESHTPRYYFFQSSQEDWMSF